MLYLFGDHLGTIFVDLSVMKRILIIISASLILPFLSHEQECDKVLFQGRVTDTLRPQAFYNLMVINRTTGRGVFGQPNGMYSVFAKAGDVISLSIKGYPIINVTVRPDADCQHIATYYVEGKPQQVAEVVVRPLKTLSQIKEERENLAMRETRQVTGIEVLQSPITALYQAFSKKERNKRWIAEQEYKDDQRRIVKELLRNYVAYDIIDLTDDEFDEFVAFLNISDSFLKTASEMDLITFIQDKYEHYIWLKAQNHNKPLDIQEEKR